MELITTHTHTGYTNHGYGTVDELVSAAVAAGISTIAVTEHYPLTPEMDPTHYISMDWERVDEYIADIEAARLRYPNIEILNGCGLAWQFRRPHLRPR